MLSQKALDEFKEIHKAEFSEEISDEKTLELATRLITLMKVIYRPIPDENKNLWKTTIDKWDDAVIRLKQSIKEAAFGGLLYIIEYNAMIASLNLPK